jgi:uncharacterized protein (DUF302 family)
MKITVTTAKPLDKALADLQVAVKANQFGVINVLDLRDKLQEKGVSLGYRCCVVDVCNPQKALAVLTQEPAISAALPCRISVYEQGGKTCFTTMRPTAILSGFADAPSRAAVAQEVEQTLTRIMEQAA